MAPAVPKELLPRADGAGKAAAADAAPPDAAAASDAAAVPGISPAASATRLHRRLSSVEMDGASTAAAAAFTQVQLRPPPAVVPTSPPVQMAYGVPWPFAHVPSDEPSDGAGVPAAPATGQAALRPLGDLPSASAASAASAPASRGKLTPVADLAAESADDSPLNWARTAQNHPIKSLTAGAEPDGFQLMPASAAGSPLPSAPGVTYFFNSRVVTHYPVASPGLPSPTNPFAGFQTQPAAAASMPPEDKALGGPPALSSAASAEASLEGTAPPPPAALHAAGRHQVLPAISTGTTPRKPGPSELPLSSSAPGTPQWPGQTGETAAASAASTPKHRRYGSRLSMAGDSVPGSPVTPLSQTRGRAASRCSLAGRSRSPSPFSRLSEDEMVAQEVAAVMRRLLDDIDIEYSLASV